jgi:polysaccharide export outer membrane protein
MRTTWLLLALGLSGCAHTGSFVWVDAYRPAPSVQDAPYRLGPGDVVALRVIGHDEFSVARAQVRGDGRISLPLNADLEVNGMSLDALSTILRTRLKAYLANPAVSLTLEQPRPLTVSVVGEVNHPGSYALDPHTGLLTALASAGGFTPYAHDDRIFVLRRTSPEAPPVRIRFKYEALAHAEGAAATFTLKRYDVVVVE